MNYRGSDCDRASCRSTLDHAPWARSLNLLSTTVGLLVAAFVLTAVACGSVDDAEAVTSRPAELKPTTCDGDCGGGDDPTQPTHPVSHPPAPPPLQSFVIGADLLQTLLGSALAGTSIQLSQNGETTREIREGQIQCHEDSSAAMQCRKNCVSDTESDPSGEDPDCVKRCSTLNTTVCTSSAVCGTYPEQSYIAFGPSILSYAGTQACHPDDCQPCDANEREPALFDRALVGIPSPLVSHQAGLITYHCTMTKLRFDMTSELPVTVDLGGVHLVVRGDADSPALSCDNGAPDLDFSDPTVTIDLMPFGQGGSVATMVLGHFSTGVSAHNPLGNVIDWLDDAQNLVTSHGTTAINDQVQKLAVEFGAGLDHLGSIVQPAAKGRIDHVTYGTTGLTIYYSAP